MAPPTHQPHPNSWELNIQQDIARSVLQEQIIIKNINAIHALVRLQKPDLHSSLPGMGQKVHNLVDDYQHGIRILTTRLGRDHHQVQHLMERRDQLAGEAKGIMWLLNSILTRREPPAALQGHYNMTTIGQGHSDVTTISQGHSDVTTISKGHSDVTTTSQGPADDISMAPVPRPICIQILKEQKSEILEIVETIHDNIEQLRADLINMLNMLTPTQYCIKLYTSGKWK
jgi:hypothetical protein